MSRAISIFLGLAWALSMTSVVRAHHPPEMERCASFSFTGQIERIEWRRPHVELYVRTDEGVTHHVIWLAIHQLSWEGIDRDTLRVGDEVHISAGIRMDDVVERPMLLSYIHRDSDGWGWSQVPQGC